MLLTLLQLGGAACVVVVIICYYIGVGAWLAKPRWALSKKDKLDYEGLDLARAVGRQLSKEEVERFNYYIKNGFRTWEEQNKTRLMTIFWVLLTIILIVGLFVGVRGVLDFLSSESSEIY